MREFIDSSPLLGDPAALRERLDDQSHLFFRGLLDPDLVRDVRRQVVEVLDGLGWLAAGHDVMEARPGPGATGEGASPSPEFFEAYTAVQSLQAFHELAHDPAIVGAVGGLVGDDVLVHPRKIFRVSPADDPRFVTPPHQDFRLIQGTVDVFTAWLPLGDCPDELGGLAVLAGSHRRGLEQVRLVQATGGVCVDVDADDPAWTTTSFRAGDLLLFHSLTVHRAKPNRSDRLRLSADYRYQAASQPVVKESLAPHYHPIVPGHDVLTEGWTSTASVDTPAGLVVTEMADPFDTGMRPPPSRVLSSPA